MKKTILVFLIAVAVITCKRSDIITMQTNEAVSAGKGGPPIKDQQCSVLPLNAPFSISNRLFIANRSNEITGYLNISTNSDGFLIGAPDLTLTGTQTQLSFVSRNYLVGIVRDNAGRIYVAGPNTGTVTVYPPLTGVGNNFAPIGILNSNDGLSQPSGLALDKERGIIYVANTGNGTVTSYNVIAGSGSTVTFQRRATLTGLSAPLGLAINSNGTRLYIANRGNNTIVVAAITDAIPFTVLTLPNQLQDLTGPIGIAVNPSGTKLYVANNGKINNWYSVTLYSINTDGIPSATASHIGGDMTGLCNPASVAVDPGGALLYVASRESSGGSITVFKLDATTGSLLSQGTTTDFNLRPAAMMLHDAINRLGAPVGLIVVNETIL